MILLFELTLRGSAAVLLVLALDRFFALRIDSRSRRLWWLVIPLAFLVPLRLPAGPLWQRAMVQMVLPAVIGRDPATEATILTDPAGYHIDWILTIWIAGVVASLALVATRTVRASRLLLREGTPADLAVMGLLDACRRRAGVRGAVGLVVSDTVRSPAIMGWFRPRILLPASLAASATPMQLQAIFFHELAHHRSLDILSNWLVAVLRAIHWFNPLAYLGGRAWGYFCEEAADEMALGWMPDGTAGTYGETLVFSLRAACPRQAPFGSLAIVDSLQHLKKRIHMISCYSQKSPHLIRSGIFAALLLVAVATFSARAAGPVAEVGTVTKNFAQSWLEAVDAGQYQLAWDAYTSRLQGFIGTVDSWTPMAAKSRGALGKCVSRRLATEVVIKRQADPGFPAGEYAYVYFDSQFENSAKPQREYLILFQGSDGAWKIDSWSVGDRDRAPLPN